MHELRATGWSLALLLCQACAHAPPCPGDSNPVPEAPAAPRPQQPVERAFTVVDGITGIALSPAEWRERLRAARVVYVGESHDDAAHHYVQLRVFEDMLEQEPSVGVALEMLNQDQQPALTGFVTGKTDAAAFQKAVEWEKTWGYPFGFYEPLLTRARQHDAPAFALNAPRSLTRAMYQKGIEGLGPDELQRLPEMQPGPAAHREYAREAFGAHARSRFTDAKFERFYQAQLTWDETMAANVAQALDGQNAPKRLLVIAGEGHTRRFAIPDRAARRGATPFLTVLAVEADQADAARAAAAADVLFILAPLPADDAAATPSKHP